jgi:MFS transporter, ACS family, tartrate transporter
METASGASAPSEAATFRKVAWRIVPLLFLGYIAAFLDRVNVGFAKLQMASDLQFSDAVYGFGAGIFFIGYFLFEVPSNLVLRKVGARIWIARIMLTWGVISSAFVFTGMVPWGPVSMAFGCTDEEFTFYVLRFLLGAAEAGFFPGVILFLTYWFPAERRARMVAWFMTGIAVSNIIGSPVSGAILQYMDGAQGLRGWQWLFALEGLPSLIMGVVIMLMLPDRPQAAKWLSDEERNLVLSRIAEEEASRAPHGKHSIAAAFKDWRIWAFGFVYFTGALCLYTTNFWMPTLISEFGVGTTDFLQVGLISMIPWGVTAVVQVLWAWNSDRTGERRFHTAGGFAMCVVGMSMLALIDGQPALQLTALTLTTCGAMCWVVVFWSIPTSFLSGAAAAAGIAWINSIGNLGGHFGPDLIGRIRAANGGNADAAFLTLAAAALLGGIVVLIATMKPKANAALAA